MQKVPTASVNSGHVVPTVIGRDRDLKEMYMLSGLVLFLAVVVAAFWYYSQSDEATHPNRATNSLTDKRGSQTDGSSLTASVPTVHIQNSP